jgi:UDPglucose 6-dehydrogenase
LAAGAKVRAHDPEGMDEARHLLDGVEFVDDPYEALKGAHAMVLCTEWDQYRALDLDRVKSLLKTPTVVDLRNVYNPSEMEGAGFNYDSVGRK